MELLVLSVTIDNDNHKGNDKQTGKNYLTGTKHKFVVLQLQKYGTIRRFNK